MTDWSIRELWDKNQQSKIKTKDILEIAAAFFFFLEIHSIHAILAIRRSQSLNNRSSSTLTPSYLCVPSNSLEFTSIIGKHLLTKRQMPSSMINHRLIVRVLLSVVTTGTIILNSSRYHGKMYFVDALLTSASSSSFVASSRSSTAAAVSPGALSFVCNVEFKRSAPNCRRNECSFTRLHATPPSQRRVARRDLKKVCLCTF